MNLREYAAEIAKGKTAPKKHTEAVNVPAKEEPTASARPQQMPEEYRRIYREVFNFHARHTPAPGTLEEWQETVEDLTRTIEATGSTSFAQAMLQAVFEEMERQQKKNS